jgi:hypothetical protein
LIGLERSRKPGLMKSAIHRRHRIGSIRGDRSDTASVKRLDRRGIGAQRDLNSLNFIEFALGFWNWIIKVNIMGRCSTCLHNTLYANVIHHRAATTTEPPSQKHTVNAIKLQLDISTILYYLDFHLYSSVLYILSSLLIKCRTAIPYLYPPVAPYQKFCMKLGSLTSLPPFVRSGWNLHSL